MLCVFFRLATAAALNTHIIWQKRGAGGCGHEPGVSDVVLGVHKSRRMNSFCKTKQSPQKKGQATCIKELLYLDTLQAKTIINSYKLNRYF